MISQRIRHNMMFRFTAISVTPQSVKLMQSKQCLRNWRTRPLRINCISFSKTFLFKLHSNVSDKISRRYVGTMSCTNFTHFHIDTRRITPTGRDAPRRRRNTRRWRTYRRINRRCSPFSRTDLARTSQLVIKPFFGDKAMVLVGINIGVEQDRVSDVLRRAIVN